jgi:DNA-binding transcriptional regulator YhcF (GntR family)
MNMQTGRFESGTPPAHARAILRADDEAMLRRIAIAGAPLDNAFTPAIIWYTIFTQNVRKLMRSPANIEFGATDAIPPDEMREPISVHAVAKILRMPYETVRRQVVQLEARGLCTRIPDRGLIVSNETFARPEIFQQVILGNESVRMLLTDLARAGFDFAGLRESAVSPAQPATDQSALTRAMTRLDTEYVLETFEVLRKAVSDDLVKAIFYLAVATACTRDAASIAPAPDFDRPDALVPDELRRPVSVLALSRAQKVPYETLRRTLGALERDGVLRRVSRMGVIVPAAVQAEIESEALVRRRLALLHRYMGELLRVGVALPA